MVNIFKLCTKAGRQSLVRDAAKEYLTPTKVAQLTSDGVNRLLKSACEGIPDEKMEAVCNRCEEGAALFGAISAAVKDKVLTEKEASDICSRVWKLTGAVVTEEAVNGAIDKIVALVP